LVLLQGPAENVIQTATLATGIPNSGTFIWTPSGSLPANSTVKYGLQLIDDVTGQFQYSTQFGLSKGPECASPSVTATPSVPDTPIISATEQPSQSATSRPSTNTAAASSPSPGQKAGIALGAIFGVAILVGLSYFVYTKCGRRRARRPSPEPKAEASGAEICELQHHDVRELDGRLVTELASQPISELATPVAELEAKM
jgi:hypothetical protein